MRGFEGRIRRLEMATTAACPLITASEVSGIKQAWRRKLNLRATPEDIPAPMPCKALVKAYESALQKLRSFLERTKSGISR